MCEPRVQIWIIKLLSISFTFGRLFFARRISARRQQLLIWLLKTVATLCRALPSFAGQRTASPSTASLRWRAACNGRRSASPCRLYVHLAFFVWTLRVCFRHLCQTIHAFSQNNRASTIYVWFARSFSMCRSERKLFLSLRFSVNGSDDSIHLETSIASLSNSVEASQRLVREKMTYTATNIK